MSHFAKMPETARTRTYVKETIATTLNPDTHNTDADTRALDLIAHHPDATDQQRAAAAWHLMLGQAERVLGA